MRIFSVIALIGIFDGFRLVESGAIVVGQKYYVPGPQDLPNMPDYTNMVNQCAADKGSAGCTAAINQFVSDIHLMLPDTLGLISSLNDQVTTNKDLSTTKQGQINDLTTSVGTLSTQLLTTSDALDAADTAYATALATVQSTVNGLLDQQQSPMYKVAAVQQQAMLDKLTALGTATSAYLAAQNDNIKATANYVYSLFTNDQSILGNSASTQLATSTNTAATLTQNIQDMRTWWAGNVSTEQGNLDAQKVKVAAAKADADAKARAAKLAIASSIQGGIDSAMATARAAYDAQISNITAAINNVTKSAYSRFDSFFAEATANDTLVTTKIDANVTDAQSKIDSLRANLAVRVQAATTAKDDAVSGLQTNQISNMKDTVSKGATLNSTVSELTQKVADVSSKIFRASQIFMTNFANLASDASGSASGAMAQSAEAAGDSMSSLNGYIGGMSGGADASSQSAASNMANAVTSARDGVAARNLKQIMALADAINAITTLVALMKAKMGQSSDKADVSLDAIQSSLEYSINGLRDTLGAISTTISNNIATETANAQERVAQIATLSSNARHANEDALAQTRSYLDTQIAEVASGRIAAGAAADAVALDGANLAQALGVSNQQLGVQVSALKSKLDTAWANVRAQRDDLNVSAISALRHLNESAISLADLENRTALGAIVAAGTSFNATVKTVQASVLQSQKDALTSLNATADSLMADFETTGSEIASLVTDATDYAGKSITYLSGVPETLADKATVTMKALSDIADKYLQGMRDRVAVVEQGLMWTIGNKTQDYRSATTPAIQALNASLTTLAQKYKDAQAAKDSLFGGGDATLFTLSPDAFRARVQAATWQVGNASLVQDSRLSWLQGNLSDAYMRAQTLINNGNALVATFVPNVSTAVGAAISSVQTQIAADTLDFDQYTAGLLASLSAQSESKIQTEKDAMNVVRSNFDAVMTNAQNQSDGLVAKLSTISATETAKQAALADSMDSIIQTMIKVSGNNANALAAMQAQFAKLQASTFGISDRLNASLNNAVGAISAAAAKADAELQKQLRSQSSQTIATTQSLGSRLAFALDAVASGNADDLASLGDADADALALAQSLSGLGANAKQQIRVMLGKLQTGELSMNDVLSAKSDVNLAQLTTAEDVIVAFTDYMNKYLVGLQSVYSNESDKLNAFESAVPSVLSTYNVTRKDALAAANSLADAAKATVTTYQQTVKDVLADSATAVTNSKDALGAMQDSVPVLLSQVKANIKAAIEQVEVSQDALADQLIAAAKNTRSHLVRKLGSFRTTKNSPNYALSVEDVLLPTKAPLIAITPP